MIGGVGVTRPAAGDCGNEMAFRLVQSVSVRTTVHGTLTFWALAFAGPRVNQVDAWSLQMSHH